MMRIKMDFKKALLILEKHYPQILAGLTYLHSDAFPVNQYSIKYWLGASCKDFKIAPFGNIDEFTFYAGMLLAQQGLQDINNPDERKLLYAAELGNYLALKHFLNKAKAENNILQALGFASNLSQIYHYSGHIYLTEIYIELAADEKENNIDKAYQYALQAVSALQIAYRYSYQDTVSLKKYDSDVDIDIIDMINLLIELNILSTTDIRTIKTWCKELDVLGSINQITASTN